MNCNPSYTVSLIVRKPFCEGEKMLLNSIVSSFHNVFKLILPPSPLTHSLTMTPFDAPGKQAF